MSCDGNRFVCGMKRFDKHKTTTERPVLNDLHNNNEKIARNDSITKSTGSRYFSTTHCSKTANTRYLAHA